MKSSNSLLIIRQLDKKLQELRPLQDIGIPPGNWISTLRKALKMSLRQLGDRMSIKLQSVRDMELREIQGTITINALKEAANGLEMELVYGFIPKGKSLEKMIEQKANDLAKKIVLRTSTTMKLEDQENSKERIQQAIDDMTEEIKREMPKSLWD